MYSASPSCATLTYNNPASFSGFKAYQCVATGDDRSRIAWTPTRSSPGDSKTTISDSPPSISTPDPNGGLSNSDKITLGCTIGIGLPATLAALVTCWKALRQR
ncbi:hypothetical protein PG995_004175 [Apiospora arundinis]